MPLDAAAALPVFVQAVPNNHQLSQVCSEYRLDSPQLLLVSATSQGIEALRRAAAKYGVRSQSHTATPGFVPAYAPSIVDFARQHPDRLLARPGTGSPYLVVDEETGAEYTPWADLGEF